MGSEHVNCEFLGKYGELCRSVRWVELLDGTVRARLMTDTYPTEIPSADPDFSAAVLSGLRRVPWRPEHNWIFPKKCRRRMVFLSWVGRSLGLNPTWTLGVLPFIAVAAEG